MLIVHPGGPFFAKKDNGFWSIPKGLYEGDENPLDAAKREYEEEIGRPAPDGTYIELGEIKRKDGKIIKAWAVEGTVDETKITSNTFKIEWPPKSAKMQAFPEVDRAGWFTLGEAVKKLTPAQVEFLQRLADKLDRELTVEKPQPNQQTFL